MLNQDEGSLTLCSSNNPDAESSSSLTNSSCDSFFSTKLTAATRRRTKRTQKLNLMATIYFWIPIPSAWLSSHFIKGLYPQNKITFHYPTPTHFNSSAEQRVSQNSRIKHNQQKQNPRFFSHIKVPNFYWIRSNPVKPTRNINQKSRKRMLNNQNHKLPTRNNQNSKSKFKLELQRMIIRKGCLWFWQDPTLAAPKRGLLLLLTVKCWMRQSLIFLERKERKEFEEINVRACC